MRHIDILKVMHNSYDHHYIYKSEICWLETSHMTFELYNFIQHMCIYVSWIEEYSKRIKEYSII